MTIARTVREVLQEHVTLEVEGIDRLYLNLYIPMLQTPRGVAAFWIHHRGHRYATSKPMAEMTAAFVRSIAEFADARGIPIVAFKKKQRKDDIAKEHLAKFAGASGVLFIGKAQEKSRVVRTERRTNPETGGTYPWLVNDTALVNQFYFYCVDDDFGPFFIKLGSYFPYNGRVCLNGHEYLKRQLQRRGIAFEALDNGLLRCADPAEAQRICDALSPEVIETFIRKWLRRLPHPFGPEDSAVGCVHDISVLQAEFSLTQVLDRPVNGRVFFEQVIRENIDIGRPDRVQLIFDRRVIKSTPSSFRTRIVTDGVIPSLHVDYKNTRVKQYHKEGRALRTETTINDTFDFRIGRRLKNLAALRQIGFQANRRLLDVQRISHDCHVGADAFDRIHQPATVGTQRAAALRFGERRTLALFSAILLFRLLPRGFANRDLRAHVATLMGLPPEQLTAGRMTYDLRRLKLHGLIERIRGTNRYQVTDEGAKAALFITRLHHRLIRPGLAVIAAPSTATSVLAPAIDAMDAAVGEAWRAQTVAA